MLKSKWLQNILRILITLLGAGLGVAVALGILQAIHLATPNYDIPLTAVVCSYAGLGLLGSLVFFLCSRRMLSAFADFAGWAERSMDRLTLPQLLSRLAGLIIGLIIASLLSGLLSFLGDSLFTVICALILYIVFGVAGFSVGRRRSQEAEKLLVPAAPHIHRFRRKKLGHHSLRFSRSVRLLDTSALIDGRIVEICRLGFLDGELIIPDFVLDELRHVADSSDPARRARGRRGMDVAEQLRALPIRVITEETGLSGTEEVDLKLMKLAKKRKADLITGDYNLARAAQVSGVRVLNLNQLANALRPIVAAGDQLEIMIQKDGKEPGQGVGYLPDGTMVVVEGGRDSMNQTITVTVTSALQTAAGRMIFAKREQS